MCVFVSDGVTGDSLLLQYFSYNSALYSYSNAYAINTHSLVVKYLIPVEEITNKPGLGIGSTNERRRTYDEYFAI